MSSWHYQGYRMDAKTAMKVVKSTLYRGMFFYCVISIVSLLFNLQYKNCHSYTFAKNDS